MAPVRGATGDGHSRTGLPDATGRYRHSGGPVLGKERQKHLPPSLEHSVCDTVSGSMPVAAFSRAAIHRSPAAREAFPRHANSRHGPAASPPAPCQQGSRRDLPPARSRARRYCSSVGAIGCGLRRRFPRRRPTGSRAAWPRGRRCRTPARGCSNRRTRCGQARPECCADRVGFVLGVREGLCGIDREAERPQRAEQLPHGFAVTGDRVAFVDDHDPAGRRLLRDCATTLSRPRGASGTGVQGCGRYRNRPSSPRDPRGPASTMSAPQFRQGLRLRAAGTRTPAPFPRRLSARLRLRA